MKENERYVKDIQDFARSSGMKGTRYDVIREIFSGTQGEHIPSDIEVIGNVYRLRPKFRADRDIFINNINKNSCFYWKISIQDNGNVIPCEFERSYIYGNVCKNCISEILQNEKTKSLWFMDFGNVETCCEYSFACHDCRPLGRAATGNMASKNPRCMYNPYTGKWDSLSTETEKRSSK